MYKVVEVNGHLRQVVCKDGKASCYGEPKLFKTRKETEKWIDTKSYRGMSHKYEIVEE